MAPGLPLDIAVSGPQQRYRSAITVVALSIFYAWPWNALYRSVFLVGEDFSFHLYIA